MTFGRPSWRAAGCSEFQCVLVDQCVVEGEVEAKVEEVSEIVVECPWGSRPFLKERLHSCDLLYLGVFAKLAPS